VEQRLEPDATVLSFSYVFHACIFMQYTRRTKQPKSNAAISCRQRGEKKAISRMDAGDNETEVFTPSCSESARRAQRNLFADARAIYLVSASAFVRRELCRCRITRRVLCARSAYG
jgi:hypothetical protein